MTDQNPLATFLLKEKRLTQSALDAVLQQAARDGSNFEDALVNSGTLTEDQLTEVRSQVLHVPLVDLRGVAIPKKALEMIPREVAENYQMVPFALTATELRVALVDPQNFKAIEALEFLAQKSTVRVRYHITSPSSFRDAVRQYLVLGEEVKEALEGIADDAAIANLDIKDGQSMEEVIKSAPVSKMVLVIIRHAIDGRASDIHIEPTIKDSRVRYRIDGILRTSLVLPKYIHAAIVARIKVLANLKLDETRKPQDGRIRLSIEGRDIDFRVSTLPLFEGEKIVLRILDTNAKAPTLEELGFNSIHMGMIADAIRKPHGLTLLTGPTGSGKTTTLYTLLTMLNKDGINIVTLEDPIEYYIPGINQSQVHPEIGYTFASGLRAILRQDPNVVMLGEIRDQETTELVIHESLTGHMILSTLHTNSAMGAIPRLVDLGAEPFLLSSVLNLVIAQRLARKICPDCKESVEVPAGIIKRVQEKIDHIPKKYLADVDVTNLKFYKGRGCAHCADTGYQGRTAVAEVIDITSEIRDIINRNGSAHELRDALTKQDFIDLVQDCLIQALKGVTTIDEVMRVANL